MAIFWNTETLQFLQITIFTDQPDINDMMTSGLKMKTAQTMKKPRTLACVATASGCHRRQGMQSDPVQWGGSVDGLTQRQEPASLENAVLLLEYTYTAYMLATFTAAV